MTLLGLAKFESNLLQTLQSGFETLRIGLLPVKPYVFDCFDPEDETKLCRRPGLGVEIIREVCSALSVDCQLAVENHTKFGDNLSGKWQGMIRQIMDGDYNTSMPSFNPTPERLKVVEFSLSVYDDIASLVTRFPDPVQFTAGALFGFRLECLLLIGCTIFLIGMLGVVFDKIKKYGHFTESHFGVCTSGYCLGAIKRSLDAAAILFQQTPNYTEHSLAYYAIFAVWSMSCIVLIGLYSSFILAAAFTIKLNLPFWDTETLATCVKDEKCRMVAETTSSSYYERIYNADSGSQLILKAAIHVNPPLIIPRGTDKGTAVLNGKQVYNVIILSSGQHSQVVQQRKACSFDSVALQNYDQVAFPFQKKNPVKHLFDKAILLLQQEGIIERLYDKYIGGHIKEQAICRQGEVGTKPMDLPTFIGAFLAIIGGALMAAVVLILEKIVTCCRGRRLIHETHEWPAKE